MQVIQSFDVHTRYVNASAVYGTTLATASYDKSAAIWDLNSGKLLHHLKAHTDFVTDVIFSRNGGLLVRCANYRFILKTPFSTSRDKTLCVWNVESGNLMHTLAGHKRGVVTGFIKFCSCLTV